MKRKVFWSHIRILEHWILFSVKNLSVQVQKMNLCDSNAKANLNPCGLVKFSNYDHLSILMWFLMLKIVSSIYPYKKKKSEDTSKHIAVPNDALCREILGMLYSSLLKIILISDFKHFLHFWYTKSSYLYKLLTYTT